MAFEQSKRSLDYRFHLLALVIVTIGVTIGLLACLYVWATRGQIEFTTLNGCLFAVVAAFPVWRKFRRMGRAEQPSSQRSG
ncbi:hypothetical protein NG895_01370 [Aeoliella sp. ICT_H6.2]|uniref:Uncharacterized protein n=1 Tax=Aeoliella straminimaris TaxID=2954799 RepID=A0A9X2FAR8_9BACT|nr:hypothetical protein [Aeoliella straminimaris]MCO6042546.1 hypothetical protein [Aeoliella straminimaris]